MIFLEEFIEKWTGKPVDVDGIYPNQCFDLFHKYHQEVLGIDDLNTLAFPSAYQIYTDFNKPDLFEKIENTPTNIPKKGDIIVWGAEIGSWGHVSIFISGDVNAFESFDANWPIGSLPHIQEHSYAGVLGWLRYNSTTIDSSTGNISALESKIKELRRDIKDLRQSRDKWRSIAKDYEVVIKSLENAVQIKDAEIQDKNDKIQSMETALSTNITPLYQKNKNNVYVYPTKELLSEVIIRVGR